MHYVTLILLNNCMQVHAQLLFWHKHFRIWRSRCTCNGSSLLQKTCQMNCWLTIVLQCY